MLHTRRLVLEPISRSHADQLLELVRDERLFAFQPHWLPSELDALRERFAIYETGRSSLGRKQFNWVARRVSDQAYVGTVQTTFWEKGPQIGYMVFAPYWRKGYGKEEVAAVIGYLKDEGDSAVVWTSVDADNIASRALLESLDFTRTASAPSPDRDGHNSYRYERPL